MLTSRLAFVYFFSMLLVCLFRDLLVCCLLGLGTKADTRNEWRAGEGGATTPSITLMFTAWFFLLLVP